MLMFAYSDMLMLAWAMKLLAFLSIQHLKNFFTKYKKKTAEKQRQW